MPLNDSDAFRTNPTNGGPANPNKDLEDGVLFTKVRLHPIPTPVYAPFFNKTYLDLRERDLELAKQIGNLSKLFTANNGIIPASANSFTVVDSAGIQLASFATGSDNFGAINLALDRNIDVDKDIRLLFTFAMSTVDGGNDVGLVVTEEYYVSGDVLGTPSVQNVNNLVISPANASANGAGKSYS